MLHFDHIAIGCATLEQGATYMSEKSGLTVPVGGKHPLMGTHNLVMATGADTFLEVIAIDSAAPAPRHNRWFGLSDARIQSNLAARAQPLAWILNSDDLDTDLEIAKSLGVDLGLPTTQTRGDMTWQFAVREDGAIPLDGAAPMMMEWSKSSTHPAAKMPDLGARITAIDLDTPYAEILDKLLTKIGDGSMSIKIREAPETKLTVTLTLNNGHLVVLD